MLFIGTQFRNIFGVGIICVVLDLCMSVASVFITAVEDDVFYLFLQKEKIGGKLHIYLEEDSYFKKLFRGPSTAVSITKLFALGLKAVRVGRGLGGIKGHWLSTSPSGYLTAFVEADVPTPGLEGGVGCNPREIWGSGQCFL